PPLAAPICLECAYSQALRQQVRGCLVAILRDTLAFTSYRQLLHLLSVLPALSIYPFCRFRGGSIRFLVAIRRGPRRCRDRVVRWTVWGLPFALRCYVTGVIAAAAV